MKKNLMLVCGLLLAAFAFTSVLIPLNINVGGFSGLALIFNHLWGTSFLLSSTILNAGFCAWALWKHGGKAVGRAVLSMLAFNWLLDYAPRITLPVISPVVETVVVLIASLMAGCGIGLTIKAGGSTGGSDYLSELITLGVKGLSRGAASAIINVAIVCSTACIFGMQDFARAVIATVTVNLAINLTLYDHSGHPIRRILNIIPAKFHMLRRTDTAPQMEPAPVFTPSPSLLPLRGQHIKLRAGDFVIELEIIDVTAA